MSEMVERVTQAVFDSINSDPVDYCALEVARQAAKAAIEAMRLPTDPMIQEGRDRPYSHADWNTVHCWSRMITEALK